ncbi:MAG: hypothetical protein ACFFDP_09735 [Promethearchaeota archaeon]
MLLPFRKQVYRHINSKNQFSKDTLARWNEKISDATPLLKPIVQKGKLVYDFPKLEESRKYCQNQIKCLPKRYRHLTGASKYPVKLSQKLAQETEKLIGSRKIWMTR